MSRDMLIIVVALAASSAAGCLDGTPPIEPLHMEVGSAVPEEGVSFVVVEDGTQVPLVPGSQGGFHVWLGMRVRGISGRLYVEREARREADQALVFRGLRQIIDIPEDAYQDWWISPSSSPAFMCPSPIGIRVFDEALVFVVRLLDEDEEVLATDRIVLVPRCTEGAQEAFCRDICAG
jgi:hypothetical protein